MTMMRKKKTTILNEKRYAEDILNGGVMQGTEGQTMCILAKYYLSLGMVEDEIISNLQAYAHDNIPPTPDNIKYTDPDELKTTIKYVKDKSLSEIDGISITQKEIDAIRAIDVEKDKPKIQRLAFTLLVLSKYNALKYKNNAGYVQVIPKIQETNSRQRGYTDIDLMRIANIDGSNKDKRASYERALQDVGMLSCSRPDRYGAQQYSVLFADLEGKEVYSVTDLRDLGMLWRKLEGEKITRCEKCGRWIVQNRNGTKKYCKDCGNYQPLGVKYIKCVDCGKEIVVNSKNHRTVRCPECNHTYHRQNNTKYKQKYRQANKNTQTFMSAF